MFKLRTAARLAIATGLLASVMVWIALQLPLIPTAGEGPKDSQIGIAKSIAAAVTTFARHHSASEDVNGEAYQLLKQTVATCTEFNPSIHHVAVTDSHGKVLLEISGPGDNPECGGHHPTAQQTQQAKETQQVIVNVSAGDQLWGKVEVHFLIASDGRWLSSQLSSTILLTLFLFASVALAAWALFEYAFQYLSPSSIVPQRVKSALNTLTEGVVLVKQDGVIAHCNETFVAMTRKIEKRETQTVDDVIGQQLMDYPWKPLTEASPARFAWERCFETKEPVVDQIVQLVGTQETLRFSVNASPMLTPKGKCRGVLISFDNVTEIEKQREALIDTIRTVEHQNAQLTFLAACDPLTKCLNRREFFRIFDNLWQETALEKLSLLMIDVDHFKSINDAHGHSFGDQVLIHVADKIRETVGDLGTVCRYGGEEFVVLVGDVDLDHAWELADKVRSCLESSPVDGEVVTASIGFSNGQFKAMDQQHLLDQADECLYAAKHAGRNRAIRFDENQKEKVIAQKSKTELLVEKSEDAQIEYSSVTGLLAALSSRCQETAHHSLRVSLLAVKIGETFGLQKNELYRLEIAALLHDIGKIGIPDSILNKDGPLDGNECQIVQQDGEIGLQIVRNTLASEELCEILKCRHYGFQSEHARSDQKLFGEEIPLLARILFVCDVFDTLVHKKPWRKAFTVGAALEELKSSCPEQFDPAVVKAVHNFVGQQGYQMDLVKPLEVLDIRSSVKLGSYIEAVYSGLRSKDYDGLKAISRTLRTEASKAFAHELVDATIDLEDAVSQRSSDAQIEAIATDLVRLCREVRQTVLNRPWPVFSIEKHFDRKSIDDKSIDDKSIDDKSVDDKSVEGKQGVESLEVEPTQE